jgi:hypothetical protein
MTTTATTARRTPAPRRAPATTRQRKPRLRIVASKGAASRRRVPEIVAISLLCVTLLAIVVGHSMLAQGQLRIGKVSAQLTQERAINRVTVLNVAALETPARIAQAAGALHLVQPSQVLQLPSVGLDKPLPGVRITPAGTP